MPLKITIIDFDAGNLRNVQKAIEHLGATAGISKKAADIETAEVLILPGVGAFRDGITAIKQYGLYDLIRTEVLGKKKPILGICLGMQLMAAESHEGGLWQGLALLPMSIHRLQSDKTGLRIPHIGWNEITARQKSVLFKDIPSAPDFYFVHSYHAVCEDENIIAATAEYGHKFAAAVEKDNIFATQFHPEKSQRYGVQLIKNFLNFSNNYYQTRK
jgi:imidazole glycerol-phosphate synthase subunit HisH